MKIHTLLEQDNNNRPEEFVGNIETLTIENNNYRKVLSTTKDMQLVLMSLAPGEEIGEETHEGTQFIRIEQGNGRITIGNSYVDVQDGSAVIIPPNTKHNVVNASKRSKLKLYAIYSPPEHEAGTVEKVKKENG